MPDKGVVIVGYSGHAYVAIDILLQNGILIQGYCDREEKSKDPYSLPYLGSENQLKEEMYAGTFFIGIGDNKIRSAVYNQLHTKGAKFISAVHKKSIIANNVELGEAVMISASATINPLVKIGKGSICNTNCSIDHECRIGDFSHIAPGAILCGNVQVGDLSFIGANAVIKEGICIGDNVIIGAGSVVLKNVPSGAKVFGNPCK